MPSVAASFYSADTSEPDVARAATERARGCHWLRKYLWAMPVASVNTLVA